MAYNYLLTSMLPFSRPPPRRLSFLRGGLPPYHDPLGVLLDALALLAAERSSSPHPPYQIQGSRGPNSPVSIVALAAPRVPPRVRAPRARSLCCVPLRRRVLVSLAATANDSD